MNVYDYSFLDVLIEGCFVVNRDLQIEYMNQAACEQARLERSELIGKTWKNIFPDGEKKGLFAKTLDCLESQKSIDLENKYYYTDGTYSWFLLKMQPIGNSVFILSVDITKQKKAEERIEKQLKLISSLRQLDISIINMRDENYTENFIIQKMKEIIEADQICLSLYDPKTKTLNCSCSEGFHNNAIINRKIKIDEKDESRQTMFLTGAVNKNTAITISDWNDPSLSPMTWDFFPDEEFTSYAFIPIKSKLELFGAIEVFYKEKTFFDEYWTIATSLFSELISSTLSNQKLIKKLKETNEKVTSAYDKTITEWARTLETRDNYSSGHTEHIAQIAENLGRRAGFSTEQIKFIRWGALLHDLGKTGIPEDILNKPEKLSDEEWILVKKQPEYARQMLQNIDYLNPSISIPFCNHEWYNGEGYPNGLKENEIPLAAQLFSVIDVWDALANDRPYRKAWNKDKIIDYLQEMKGKQFSPVAIDLFISEYKNNPDLFEKKQA